MYVHDTHTLHNHIRTSTDHVQHYLPIKESSSIVPIEGQGGQCTEVRLLHGGVTYGRE